MELEAQAAAAEERSSGLEAELQQARHLAEEARTASDKHVQVRPAPCTSLAVMVAVLKRTALWIHYQLGLQGEFSWRNSVVFP